LLSRHNIISSISSAHLGVNVSRHRLA